jgi:para-nitrobenzyl esterase
MKAPTHTVNRAWNRSIAASPALWLAAATMLATIALPAPAALADGVIQQGTLITLADGDVQGHINGATREFLGIPYAAPPVGALRWRPPAPVTPWGGVLDASSYSNACPQLEAVIGTPSENEDCLYLNVWTPDPGPAEPLPVMVWIHGGANVAGSTGDFVPFPPYEAYRLYSAENLSGERNVVVVSLNYRLGVFGFFGQADLASEDPGFPYAGNQGLLDQRAAMEWVRDNVIAFGGDPNNVTIFGESAGSFDVCAHMVSPMSAGLFHRAISESGGCTAGIATAAENAAQSEEVSAAVGCDTAPDELACLRAVPVADLLDAAVFSEASLEISGLGISIDGGFLPDHPRTLFDAGEFSHVPYILGANSDEGTLFFIGSTPITTPEEYTAELFTRYGALAPDVEALYPVNHFASPQDALIRVAGDSTLVCTTFDVATRVSAAKNRTYVYNFNRKIPLPFVNLLHLGAFHGSELAYVFGSVPPPNLVDDALLGTRVREYWSRFAEKGKPKATKALGWPRFKGKTYKMLKLDAPYLNRLKGFRKAECEFWTSVYEQIN